MVTNISSMGTPPTPCRHGGFSCAEQRLQKERRCYPLPLPLCSDTVLALKSISIGSNATLPSVVQAKTLKSALDPLLTP